MIETVKQIGTSYFRYIGLPDQCTADFCDLSKRDISPDLVKNIFLHFYRLAVHNRFTYDLSHLQKDLAVWRPMEYISLILADFAATGLIILLRELLVKEITFMRVFSLVAFNLLGCIIIRLVYQYAYQNRSKDSKHEKILLRFLHLTGTTFTDEKVNSNRIKIAIVGVGSV